MKEDERGIVGEQIRRELECINSYRRYASLADDTALTTMINEFIRRDTDHLRILRDLGGEAFAVDRNVFEEQVYGDQPGGPNPKGYREGGTAGTEPLSGERISPESIDQAFRERPAGDNVGWRASPLNDRDNEDQRTVDLRFSLGDRLLDSHVDPEIVPDDSALVKGSKEAASLLAASYAHAASDVADPRIREALLTIRRDVLGQLQRLEQYTPPGR